MGSISCSTTLYIITQYVYVRYNRHWQTDGWIDRQLNTEQTYWLMIDRWTDEQIDRWTERQDTLEWRTPQRSGDSWSFPAVLSLSGSIPGVDTVWSHYGGTSNRFVSPPLQTQGSTTTTNKSNLHTAINLQKVILSIYLPLAICWSFVFKESKNCTSLCWHFTCNFKYSVVKQSLIIQSNLLHNILSKLYFDRFCEKQNNGFWGCKSDNGV